MELNSSSSQTSSIFSYNPLFSSIITLYILIFLYFPFNRLKLIVSPILISTLILLLSLLRLGTSQQTSQQQQSHANVIESELEPESEPKPEPWPQPQDEAECQNENESESESENEPEPEPRPQPEPESQAQPKPESRPQPEPESECELNKRSLTLGIQTSIEPEPEPKPKPKPEHKLEPSIESSLRQEEAEVGTHCDRGEIQPNINNLELESETKQVINTNITNKEDKKRRQPDPVNDPFPYSTETFVGWAVCAPLEVIYESYEGEEDVDMYAESGLDTDTDTGSSSTWEEEEEEKEGMFEIALDHGYGDYYNNNKSVFDMKKLKNEFEVDEEDNLIEIDISF